MSFGFSSGELEHDLEMNGVGATPQKRHQLAMACFIHDAHARLLEVGHRRFFAAGAPVFLTKRSVRAFAKHGLVMTSGTTIALIVVASI